MPIYEYQCDQCGHRLEALQKMADEPLRDCPACKQPALRKLVSAAAFKLTGSGWYETDFKNAGKASASSGNDAAGSGSGSDSGAAKGGQSGSETSALSSGDKGSGSAGESGADGS